MGTTQGRENIFAKPLDGAPQAGEGEALKNARQSDCRAGRGAVSKIGADDLLLILIRQHQCLLPQLQARMGNVSSVQ